MELIDTTTRDGRRVYIRGLLYIMAKALYELYPKALLTVNYQLSNSMLCEIENMEITEEFIKKLSKNPSWYFITSNFFIYPVLTGITP